MRIPHLSDDVVVLLRHLRRVRQVLQVRRRLSSQGRDREDSLRASLRGQPAFVPHRVKRRSRRVPRRHRRLILQNQVLRVVHERNELVHVRRRSELLHELGQRNLHARLSQPEHQQVHAILQVVQVTPGPRSVFELRAAHRVPAGKQQTAVQGHLELLRSLCHKGVDHEVRQVAVLIHHVQDLVVREHIQNSHGNARLPQVLGNTILRRPVNAHLQHGVDRLLEHLSQVLRHAMAHLRHRALQLLIGRLVDVNRDRLIRRTNQNVHDRLVRGESLAVLLPVLRDRVRQVLVTLVLRLPLVGSVRLQHLSVHLTLVRVGVPHLSEHRAQGAAGPEHVRVQTNQGVHVHGREDLDEGFFRAGLPQASELRAILIGDRATEDLLLLTDRLIQHPLKDRLIPGVSHRIRLRIELEPRYTQVRQHRDTLERRRLTQVLQHHPLKTIRNLREDPVLVLNHVETRLRITRRRSHIGRGHRLEHATQRAIRTDLGRTTGTVVQRLPQAEDAVTVALNPQRLRHRGRHGLQHLAVVALRRHRRERRVVQLLLVLLRTSHRDRLLERPHRPAELRVHHVPQVLEGLHGPLVDLVTNETVEIIEQRLLGILVARLDVRLQTI